MDTVYHVLKVPVESWHTEDCEFGKRGIYPNGEIMDVFEEREEAESLKEDLEENSPSRRFSENQDMEDAPYAFAIYEREL